MKHMGHAMRGGQSDAARNGTGIDDQEMIITSPIKHGCGACGSKPSVYK